MEEGELNGELDESSLSLLEINLRKKIMILTGDPKLEKKMENELRFLKRNINCLKKRKPAKEPKKPRKERPIKKPRPQNPEPKLTATSENEENDEEPKEIKIPREEISGPKIDQIPIENNTIIETVKKVSFAVPDVPKDMDMDKDKESPKPKSTRKGHTADEIIQHLMQRKEEDDSMLTDFLESKSSCSKFKYQ